MTSTAFNRNEPRNPRHEPATSPFNTRRKHGSSSHRSFTWQRGQDLKHKIDENTDDKPLPSLWSIHTPLSGARADCHISNPGLRAMTSALPMDAHFAPLPHIATQYQPQAFRHFWLAHHTATATGCKSTTMVVNGRVRVICKPPPCSHSRRLCVSLTRRTTFAHE